ncbi:MAG: alpha/beta fold hydrolase [Bacilli bacterium]|nr:alpha/beta fold hydrolase [Bacilli bacterium]
MNLFLLIPCVIILFAVGILLVLVAIKPKVKPVNERILSTLPPFNQDYSYLPEHTPFITRDGSDLDYRYYSSESDNILILLHGFSIDGKYLHSLARYISAAHMAEVYIPDLRGYGVRPKRRGDCDYIGQIDDDLADLITQIKKVKPSAKIIMGGHSMGGGTAIRFAGTRYSALVNAYLLLAPAVSPNAPINYHSKESTNLVGVSVPRVIGLTILNQLGIKRLNHLTVLIKNKPEDTEDGIETTEISYRLLISRMPNMKYEVGLRALDKPALLLVSEEDEEFQAKEYAPLFKRYNHAEVRILPRGISHDSMLLNEHTYKEISNWAQFHSNNKELL